MPIILISFGLTVRFVRIKEGLTEGRETLYLEKNEHKVINKQDKKELGKNCTRSQIGTKRNFVYVESCESAF